ncbi:hypothetical protein B0H14DRAFT_3471477 [Mycena olivaceomarginata]|nr:hypothetical protein B0H14DRAFT_3471477 [Mycena olivaceomarginata]
MTFATKGETAASTLVAVKAVQTILDGVHPGNNLTIAWRDKACSRTVARVRERRSAIAASAIGVVEELFNTKEYRDKPTAIRAFAQYAARPDGPGF